MSKYPYWYCPVYACPFSSHYVGDIEEHLAVVHGAGFQTITAERRKFWKAKNNDRFLVCQKSNTDPTKPARARSGKKHKRGCKS